MITIDLSRLTAAELALLSKMDIGPDERDKAFEYCAINAGLDAAKRMQAASLKAIDEISQID